MKKLNEYIKEAEVNGSFIYTIDLERTLDEIENEVAGLSREEYIEKVSAICPKGNDEFKKFVGLCYDAWQDFGHDPTDIPFRFNGHGHVKLARIYSDLLMGSEKIGNIKIKPGNGSIGKIKTADQEQATCLVWNAMVDDAREDGFDITNAENITEIVSSLGTKFPKSWINAFSQQCIALSNFIEKNLKGKEPKMYKACRYGDNTPVGRLYATFVSKYINACEPGVTRIPKDNYDPSDIILYTNEAEAALSKLISKVSKIQDSTQINTMFREMLFNPYIVVGVSLKKTGKTGKAEFFNIGGGTEVAKVRSITVDTHNPKSTKVIATGRFNFSGITDPNADPEDGDTIKESAIALELRSFGDYPAMDCKSANGPSLGKVPVRKWSKEIGECKPENLLELCKNFADLCNKQDKAAFEMVQKFIQWGIKNGPWCLPFVLVH